MYCRGWLALAILASLAAFAQPRGPKARERARQRMEELRERKTLQVNGVERVYTIVQPVTREAAIPMIVVFHAASANPDAMLRMSALGQKPGERKELVVYPENTNPGGAWSDGDTAFVSMLIDDLLKQDKALDRTRVYLVGAGAGGAFTQQLGCLLNAKVAAIASIGAQMPVGLEALCKTAKESMPAMLIGGNAFDFWRRQNGCQGEPVAENREGFRQVDQRTMKNCKDGAEVVQVDVKGQRQPNAPLWPPSATGEVMAFLSRFRRTPQF
ncbi:hypothetical protein F183_A23040 [Bryobacterales bacterium F-183]|nr:hypothetical protein F183_A23040 [Bryobacterales bacterium F-183]